MKVRKLKTVLSIAITAITLMTSCGKEGEIGPKGDTGAQGASGTSSLYSNWTTVNPEDWTSLLPDFPDTMYMPNDYYDAQNPSTIDTVYIDAEDFDLLNSNIPENPTHFGVTGLKDMVDLPEIYTYSISNSAITANILKGSTVLVYYRSLDDLMEFNISDFGVIVGHAVGEINLFVGFKSVGDLITPLYEDQIQVRYVIIPGGTNLRQRDWKKMSYDEVCDALSISK